MGKGKRGRGSPRHAGDKRKRDPNPPSEDFGDSEYSEEEVSSESEGSLALASPPTSSDDSDDSQGLAAEVWTYIRSVERAGLEGSDESEESSDEENSFGSSEERSGDDSDDEGNGSSDDSGDGDDDDGKGGEGDDSGDGDGGGKDDSGGGKASGKAPLV
jgi:cobaltochelatase CobT